MIGNLIIGDTYLEPQGASEIFNDSTGEKIEYDFKVRGWSGKSKDAVTGVIKDAKGTVKYQLSGKYTEKLDLKNMETGEVETIWQAPERPENSHLMYNMNSYSLQMNILPDALKQKLPPTDSRFRPDTRAWEEGRVKDAGDLKEQLENQQRARKKLLKAELGDKMKGEEWTYHKPQYFKLTQEPKEGVITYEYQEKNARGSNYWMDREAGNWNHLPRIFEPDCKPFYEWTNKNIKLLLTLKTSKLKELTYWFW